MPNREERVIAPGMTMPDVVMREIAFDTAKTVLVPVEVYEKGAAEEYLRFNGMAPEANEVAVASEPAEGIVAVMAVPTGEWEACKDEYERGEVVVTSPLLALSRGSRSGGRRYVNLMMTAENVYITVWEKGLRMAEVLPDNSVDSILYYMQVTGRQFRLRKFDINVSGRHAGLVADALRQYYKKVQVV